MGDVDVVIAKLHGGHAELRSAADVLRGKRDKVACVLASDEGGKVSLVAGLAADLVEAGLSAVEIVNKVAEVVGGGGGGRADLAQAGGPDVDRLDEALRVAEDVLRGKLCGK